MEKIIEKIMNICVDLGFRLLGFILIITIGLKLIKMLTKAIQKSKGMNRVDKSASTFIISFLSITLKVFLFITAFAYVGIPMTSMIALLGSAGVAIGLALQGGLSNIAGGIMLLLFRPFKVGDYITNHTEEGTVEEITIFYTVLRTIDNKKIVLPNGALSNESLINFSSYPKRRLDIDFSVGYDSNIDKVIEVIKEQAEKEEKVLKEDEIFVRLTNHGDNALVFTIRVWVKQEDYWNTKFNLLENVKRAFDKNKITIPYPQLDVHMQK